MLEKKKELVDCLFDLLNVDKSRLSLHACEELADKIIQAVKEEIVDNLL